MKICVFTLGCKVNQYESDAIKKMLTDKGYQVTETLEPADYYIINTCAVTAEAEKKSRQCVARALKQNPNAKILICGCASENDARQFIKDGVIYVSGTARKDLLTLLEEQGACVTEIPKTYEDYGFAASPRTRSYVKIQDGCNNFCSYCLIPYVRGRSRSRSIENVVAEVRSAAETCKEIVLTGIDISSYGKDIGLTLSDLIDALADIDVRLRLGSFEVNVIDDRLLSALKKLKRFCPHFHLSLQSGSSAVLRTMNRHYTTQEYADKVDLIRSYFPNAGLTTDVIVGFPTETDKDFAEGLDFIRAVKFSDVHCFPYSPRKGTVAYKLYKSLDANVIDKRVAQLLQLKDELRKAFAGDNLNVLHEVLFEDTEDGYAVGYTENYLRFYSKDGVHGEVAKVAGNQLFLDGIK